MKRLLPVFFALILPIAGFAQSSQGPEVKMLTQLGLTEAQISQVMDIQGKTETGVRANAVQLRLLRAQLDKALLPSTVDMQSVNTLITQMGQVRVDMQKALVAARVQLRQIMGNESFRAYTRYIRHARPGMGIEMRRTMGNGRLPRGALSDSGTLSEELDSIPSN
jgi:Spy/CpxP family protein refolding chaperone